MLLPKLARRLMPLFQCLPILLCFINEDCQLELQRSSKFRDLIGKNVWRPMSSLEESPSFGMKRIVITWNIQFLNVVLKGKDRDCLLSAVYASADEASRNKLWN